MCTQGQGQGSLLIQISLTAYWTSSSLLILFLYFRDTIQLNMLDICLVLNEMLLSRYMLYLLLEPILKGCCSFQMISDGLVSSFSVHSFMGTFCSYFGCLLFVCLVIHLLISDHLVSSFLVHSFSGTLCSLFVSVLFSCYSFAGFHESDSNQLSISSK